MLARENWSYKEISDFYNRVRMALGAVSEATLPNEYIDYQEKAPFAEATVKLRVPLWESLDETKFKVFESIVVYQTASLFQSIVSNKYIKKKQIPTITLEYADKANFDIDGMTLTELVDFLVSQLNGTDVGSSFFGFRVTKGGA